MQQFDVYENPSPGAHATVPYLIVLQHDRTSETHSVIVAPLVPKAKVERMTTSPLYPVLSIASKEHALLTTGLAAVPRAALKTRVSNQEADRGHIINALDLLFTGV